MYNPEKSQQRKCITNSREKEKVMAERDDASDPNGNSKATEASKATIPQTLFFLLHSSIGPIDDEASFTDMV